MSQFHLHPQLKRDTHRIGALALCDIRLMDNALFHWVILIPRVADCREITDLKPSQQHLLMDEITRVSEAMQQFFAADKMNVAALGNQVQQLHIHLIARKKTDAAWPNPVWGKGRVHYHPFKREKLIGSLRDAMGL